MSMSGKDAWQYDCLFTNLILITMKLIESYYQSQIALSHSDHRKVSLGLSLLICTICIDIDNWTIWYLYN